MRRPELRAQRAAQRHAHAALAARRATSHGGRLAAGAGLAGRFADRRDRGAARELRWQRACSAASQLDDLDAASARVFFETYFTPYQFANNDGTLDGLVTGYYEPLLHGSRTRHGIYQTALYRWPSGSRAGTALPPRAQLERSGV